MNKIVLEAQLKRLQSDLRDTEDPVLLVKYPHLSSPTLRQQISEDIARAEAELNSEVKHG
jgi:hypothetical protein